MGAPSTFVHCSLKGLSGLKQVGFGEWSASPWITHSVPVHTEGFGVIGCPPSKADLALVCCCWESGGIMRGTTEEESYKEGIGVSRLMPFVYRKLWVFFSFG